MTSDLEFMEVALGLAREAGRAGEVPVGAVVVVDGVVVGRGRNSMIGSADPTAHAETLAIREAAARIGNYRLPGSTLYSTLEPCAMCAGAMVWARIERVVIAVRDPKSGAAGSVLEVIPNSRLNHRPQVEFGPGEEESRKLLQDFFASLRNGAPS